MKTILVIFLSLLFSTSANSQKIKIIPKYFFKYVDSTQMTYFKVGNNLYSYGNKSDHLYKNDKLFVECSKDSTATYEVYMDKYLVVSYYPKSDPAGGVGADQMMKGRFEFILLEDRSKRWEFDFKYLHNSRSIKKFYMETGEILIEDKMIGKQ